MYNSCACDWDGGLWPCASYLECVACPRLYVNVLRENIDALSKIDCRNQKFFKISVILLLEKWGEGKRMEKKTGCREYGAHRLKVYRYLYYTLENLRVRSNVRLISK